MRRQADNARNLQVLDRGTKRRLSPVQTGRTVDIRATRGVADDIVRAVVTHQGRSLLLVLVRRASENLEIIFRGLLRRNCHQVNKAVISGSRFVKRRNLPNNVRRTVISALLFVPDKSSG